MEIEERKKTIGETLKAERARKKLSLDEVQAATRIHKRFLKSIEESNFSLIPTKVSARGFLKVYVDFLGLDTRAVMAEYDRENGKDNGTRPVITQPLVSNKGHNKAWPHFRLKKFF